MDFLYYVPGLTIGLVLFVIPLQAYRKGIETGLSISKGNSIPKIIKTPKMVQDFLYKKEDKENTEFTKAFNNLMSYVGEPQEKESEKK